MWKGAGDVTPAEIRIAVALGSCTFLPGSWDKRFARDMAFAAKHAPDASLTDRQLAHLLRLSHKYRRQIPARVLEESLDVMERAADHRVANGLPALPDFAPVKHAAKERAEISQPATAQLSLPFQCEIRDQK